MDCRQTDRRRLRAPEGDRAVLMAPPPGRVSELIGGNLHIRDQLDYDLQGRPLAEISSMARIELVDAARRWTAAYRDVPARPPDASGLIFLAGHQPQMFHPGVWLKNFALGALAEKHGATAVNLIVDGDAVSDTSLAVPTGTVGEPRTVRVPFDRPDPKIPYEERVIEDRALFASFDRRVVREIAPLVREPLVERYWRLVRERAKESANLGACLAQARHQLEGQFLEGSETLEVPQSWLCAGEAFPWFAAHLLARLPRFRRLYNEALREYRQLHHLRSRSHPAPELGEEGGWQESPFWIWTVESPRRRRLFVRAAGGEIFLSDRETWETRLPLSAEGNAGRAVERLMELGRGGVRIRPRALATTLWARLALGDLFIHGIGGAKYDWVTDRLIERFFALRPPGFLVLSATLHLPIEHVDTTADEVRAMEGELRGMTYHPERHLMESDTIPRPLDAALQRPMLGDLIAAKRRWVETPETVGNARRRCRAIRQINAALQSWLEERRRRLTERHGEALRSLRAERILAWREYAFCLHPEPALREFLSGLLPKIV